MENGTKSERKDREEYKVINFKFN